jgi:hypothetical protein
MKSDATSRWPDTGSVLVKIRCFLSIADRSRVLGDFDPCNMMPEVGGIKEKSEVTN